MDDQIPGWLCAGKHPPQIHHRHPKPPTEKFGCGFGLGVCRNDPSPAPEGCHCVSARRRLRSFTSEGVSRAEVQKFLSGWSQSQSGLCVNGREGGIWCLLLPQELQKGLEGGFMQISWEREPLFWMSLHTSKKRQEKKIPDPFEVCPLLRIASILKCIPDHWARKSWIISKKKESQPSKKYTPRQCIASSLI